jgi:hypothetical protein
MMAFHKKMDINPTTMKYSNIPHVLLLYHTISKYIYIYPILTFHGIPLDHFFVVISWIYHMSSSHPAAGATAVGHLNPAYGWPG